MADTGVKSEGLRGEVGLAAGADLRLPPDPSLPCAAGSSSQPDDQPQAHDPGSPSELSLPRPTQHLRSQLAQCRQRYQDLQEKLLVAEATVSAQASQLEKFRLMLSKSRVPVTKRLSAPCEATGLGDFTCPPA